MQEIGKYLIKRPKFILFLDKDGTTDLDDKNLNNIFHLVSTMGGMVIFVTGRTVGDIKGELERKGKEVPQIIAGDNGAVVCYTKTGEMVEQKILDHDKVMELVDAFIEYGGNSNWIRYTNGWEVFASDNEEVKEYYKKNKSVTLCEDIYESIKEAENITKVTLAGSKGLMQQEKSLVESLDYWTDMDITKFPEKHFQNYRLDIATKNISKGEIVSWLVEKLSPEYGYMCLGNGANDKSMFKVAIDNNMTVAMMERTPLEVLEEIQQYAKERKRGKVEIVPHDKNLANQYILKKAKVFQEHMVEKESMKPKKFPNLPRVQVKRIDTRNISRGMGWKEKGRDR